ncbi:MAG: TIGR02391 family protein [Chloroflexi bacterium]|nr:TIGR02391 family protein [Chloroflexota bacterium]
MTNSHSETSRRISFTSAQLEQIADRLVSDEVTHRVLDRKFRELNIVEPTPEPSPQEASFRKSGLQAGRDYYIIGSSKKERLLYAVEVMYKQNGGQGVLHLVRTLYDLVLYAGNPDKFAEFCDDINRILRFSGYEYRDDGHFYRVVETRTLSEAERRVTAVTNKFSSRRVHPEVQKYCKSEYMQENYFHAVFEAAKGLAERIREKTGLKIDGVNLAKQSFERPKNGLPRLVINSLGSQTEQNEHDGFMNLILGSFQMFRNPIAHTPRVKWQRDLEDAVDCLTLISFLHFVLDECHPIPIGQRE